MRTTKARKYQAKFTLNINGHVMSGKKDSKGRWTFKCEQWPDLAKEYNGDLEAGPMMTRFVRNVTSE